MCVAYSAYNQPHPSIVVSDYNQPNPYIVWYALPFVSLALVLGPALGPLLSRQQLLYPLFAAITAITVATALG